MDPLSWNDLHKWVVRYGDDDDCNLYNLREFLQVLGADSETTTKCIAHHFAAISNSTRTLNYLIENSPRELVNKRNSKGLTPLHWSCFSHHSALNNFKLLLSNNANPQSIDFHKNTVLHAAIEAGNFDLTSYIISRRLCSLDSKNIEGITPLQLACELHCITLLIKAGAEGSSLCGLIKEYIKQGEPLIVARLIRNSVPMKCVDEEGRNPLHIAVLNDRYHIVKKLLSEHDAEHCWIEKVDFNGQKPADLLTKRSKEKIHTLFAKHITPCVH